MSNTTEEVKKTNPELDLDDENTLTFEVSITTSSKTILNETPVIKLTIEDKDKGINYSFACTEKKQDVCTFNIPSMKGVLNENQSYSGKLEVFIGNKYFNPLTTELKFTPSIKVEAKSNTFTLVNKKEEKKVIPQIAQNNIVPRQQHPLLVKKQINNIAEEKDILLEIEKIISSDKPSPQKQNNIPAAPKKPTIPIKETHSSENELKNRFKKLFSEAIKDLK